jgi:hypothetical protein
VLTNQVLANVVGYVFEANVGEVAERTKSEINEFVIERVEFAEGGDVDRVTQ